jgi:hypothetical protein
VVGVTPDAPGPRRGTVTGPTSADTAGVEQPTAEGTAASTPPAEHPVDPPTGSPTRFGGALAAALGAVVGLLVGVSAGVPGVAGLAVVSGAVAAGAVALSAGSPVGRAFGSVAALAGTGVALAAVTYARSPTGVGFAVAVTAGVATVGVAAQGRLHVETVSDLIAAALTSGSLALPFTVVALLVHQGVFRAVGSALADGLFVAATMGPFVGFVSLQVAAVAAAVLFDRALPVFERYADDGYRRPPALEAVRLPLRSTAGDGNGDRDGPDPAATLRSNGRLIALFGVELGLLVTGWGPAAFEWLLQALGPLGSGLGELLTSGVLLVPVAAVAGLLGAVVLAERLRDPLERLAGRTHPDDVAAAAAGGLALGVVLLAGVPPIGTALRDMLVVDIVERDAFASVGVGGVLLVGVTGLALVTGVSAAVVGILGHVLAGLTAGHGRGFTAGATLLGAATVAGATLGAPAPAVFLGIAGSMAVWDVGHNAAGLGRLVGRKADSARPETVHAGGTLLVGLAGVLVASVGTYLVGPIVGLTGARALVALACTLVALVAFSLASGED